jgi:hypothetical protein
VLPAFHSNPACLQGGGTLTKAYRSANNVIPRTFAGDSERNRIAPRNSANQAVFKGVICSAHARAQTPLNSGRSGSFHCYLSAVSQALDPKLPPIKP